MSSSEQFDVFLAHSTVDKPQVRIIARKLRERGLTPWLDEEQIAPGELFQSAIQRAIPQIKAAAIIIGLTGLGKWQAIELQTLISQFVNSGSPVIPVLLPDVERITDDLPILQQFHWVSFASIDDGDAFYSLEWGITGVKPSKQSNPRSETSSASKPIEVVLPSLTKFNFDVVILDTKGKEVKREKRQTEYISENLDNGVTLEMVSIPAGGFMMGAPSTEQDSRDSERPQHQVSVPAFFMGKYQITQAQWRQVAAFPKVKIELNPDPSTFKGDNRPVELVSWLDALEFCRRLSNKTGQEYRLPSEAEWEYACRAGTTTPFHFGETIKPELVNYDGNNPYGDAPKGKYRSQTTEVGSFKLANAFGLYDMHGNVWEWCADDWSDNYEAARTDTSIWINDIKNYEAPETLKVLRGGSWFYDAGYCRAANRLRDDARVRYYNVGFRLLLASSS